MLIGFRIFALGLHRYPEDSEVDKSGDNPLFPVENGQMRVAQNSEIGSSFY
jgi:hypothetical protein